MMGSSAAETGYIVGYVVDGNGAPLSGVTILAVNSTSGEGVTVKSNQTGFYRLFLVAGQYNVSAGLANYSSDRSYVDVAVPGSGSSLYNFTMTEQLCSITGYVSAGTPVFGATVHLSNAEFNYTAISVTPYGRYDIRNIQPGVYVAYAEKEGYNPTSIDIPIILPRGASVEINFTLELQAAQVYGQVLNDANKALSGVKVVLTPTDGSVGSITTTDASGNYTFNSQPSGNYTISFYKDGFQTRTFDLTLEPYGSKRIDITLSASKKNTTAVLFGYDLTHSLMIISFLTGFIVVIASIYLVIRSQRKPELLAKVSEEQLDDRPKE
ncbi:MAG: Cna protein B-type domain protein [Methanomassiliicoccales archaeon PtaU1.Bin124]|nr:MAG: Cna protein B-type domain protein [Methanomassiliicoccales archaeon PtaU1.Bin124]